LIEQHVRAPPVDIFDAVKKETPNYSLRMSDLTACCVRPQIDTLEERIETYNTRYAAVAERLSGIEEIHVPEINERVRPVCDSMQFNLRGMRPDQIASFLDHTKRRGMALSLFGSKDNARNFRNWQYSPVNTEEELPVTSRIIASAIDVRLPAVFDDEDFDLMADVVIAAIEDVRAEEPDEACLQLTEELADTIMDA